MWVQEQDVKFGNFTYKRSGLTSTPSAPTQSQKNSSNTSGTMPITDYDYNNNSLQAANFNGLSGTANGLWNHMSDGAYVLSFIPFFGRAFDEKPSTLTYGDATYNVVTFVTKDASTTQETMYYKYIESCQGATSETFGWNFQTVITGPYVYAKYKNTYSNQADYGSYLGFAYGHRLALIPAGKAPVITNDYVQLGTIASPTSLSFNVQNTSASMIVLLDNEQKDTGTANMGANKYDWTSIFNEASKGAHELVIQTKANNYTCAAKWTFTKVEAGIQLEGTPISLDYRPNRVTVIRATSYAPESVETIDVCNNANDENPTWETYQDPIHVFENETKTAEDWAVNWRLSVDNSQGTTQAQIFKQIGLGVS